MSNLRFTLAYEDLVSVFGTSNVHRSDRKEVEALGFSGETLEFLCTVGLPSMPQAELEAPGGDCLLWDPEEEPEGGWDLPEETRKWVILGNMPGSMLALDPDSGIVYGSYGDFEEYIPMHSDISSLSYTIYATKKALREISLANTYEERKNIIESVKREIIERDPLPFEHKDSEWRASFEEIAMGMWS